MVHVLISLFIVATVTMIAVTSATNSTAPHVSQMQSYVLTAVVCGHSSNVNMITVADIRKIMSQTIRIVLATSVSSNVKIAVSAYLRQIGAMA